MSTESLKTDSISLSEDITVSKDLQTSQSIIIAAVREDFPCTGEVASQSTSVGEALALDETTSGAASNADNHTASESTHSAEKNPTEESSDASTGSSAIEESGDSGAPFVKTGEHKIRKVTFAALVCEDGGGATENGISRDLTTPTRVADESRFGPESSIETVNYRCCPEHRGLIGYFRIKMMYFRQSKYFLLLQFVLLIMPVTSGFAGAKYMYRCPASPGVAIFFFMMGIIGTVVLCERIYAGFKKALFPNWTDLSDGFPVAGLLLLLIIFITELVCFFMMEPEFTHTRSSAKFCDEEFYYLATWMNYSGISLIIVLLLLHCLGINSYTTTYVPHVTHQPIG